MRLLIFLRMKYAFSYSVRYAPSLSNATCLYQSFLSRFMFTHGRFWFDILMRTTIIRNEVISAHQYKILVDLNLAEMATPNSMGC